MKRIMGYGINIILVITIPAAVGLIVLSKPIVKIAFERGAFDTAATVMTSQALIFYSIGIVAMALRLLITKVYYSLQDTKTPMINGAISVGFNIVLNLILVRFMAHSGLALATSIASTIATFLFLYGLKRKIGSLGTIKYIKCGLKSGAASIIMGFVVYEIYYAMNFAISSDAIHEELSLITSVGTGIIVYLALCYAFRIEEVRTLINAVKGKLKIS
jgi:putative peptidoglycan lipid II flippase